MTKQGTYLLLGGGAVVAYVLVSKQKAAAAAKASPTSSLSGLIGGGIAAVKSLSDTFGNIFGGAPKSGGSGSTYDSTKVNDSALSFLSTQQKLDLGMQVPADTSPTDGTFFGPDINPFSGDYSP